MILGGADTFMALTQASFSLALLRVRETHTQSGRVFLCVML